MSIITLGYSVPNKSCWQQWTFCVRLSFFILVASVHTTSFWQLFQFFSLYGFFQPIGQTTLLKIISLHLAFLYRFFYIIHKTRMDPKTKIDFFQGMKHSVWKLPKMSHLNIWILAFYLSGSTVWPKTSRFQKTRQNWPFLILLMNFGPLKM